MTKKLATMDGKEAALKALKLRRANKPKQIDNGSLHAGSPMYFYCKTCGHLSDTLPENFINPPRKMCKECQTLLELGWLE